jgi:DNA-directed RNA polymerase subunit RPC12/RpoP
MKINNKKRTAKLYRCENCGGLFPEVPGRLTSRISSSKNHRVTCSVSCNSGPARPIKPHGSYKGLFVDKNGEMWRKGGVKNLCWNKFVILICIRCNKEFIRKKGFLNQDTKNSLCSYECSYKFLTESKIGNKTQPNRRGYISVLMPNHPNSDAGGYILEHRLVMSQHIGRPLTSKETVHHKNGIKNDNRIENLELYPGPHGSGILPKDRIDEAIRILEEEGYKVIPPK